MPGRQARIGRRENVQNSWPGVLAPGLAPDEQVAAGLALEAEFRDRLRHAGIGVVVLVVKADDAAGRERGLPGA